MTNTLLNGLRRAGNLTFTENGAISNKSTFSDVLDLFFHAPARRGQDNTRLFANAYAEDRILALKTAFYVRDIRGGQGERNTFVQILNWLYQNDVNTFNKVVELVPVYGRWKDIRTFVDSPIVARMVRNQLMADRVSDNPSLLAKWMPMENTSSPATKALALKWIKALDSTPSRYRHLIVGIRRKLNMPETLMSAGKFSEINYEHVPSRAATLYRKAYSKRDAERYVAYLQAVKKGEKTIKAATLYPYELVEGYMRGAGYDETIELQWKALPNFCVDNDQNAIVVVDVSASMQGKPMTIAVSLGLYIAERNTGAFHNYFITFSEHPELVKVQGNNLRERVLNTMHANWSGNTDLQKVIDLILTTAVKNRVPQNEMPKKLYIVSDMQFDSACGHYSNFDAMKRKFAAAGYEFPTIVFWNADSRHDETPVTQDDRGAFLVSGCSPSIFKATINAVAVTPMEMMLEVLNSDRYAAVEEALV